jgi:NitT/TauT family transport system substrate-binding protein
MAKSNLPSKFFVALGVTTLGLLATVANAQDTKWRHGVIEPKSDAGIFLMVTNGFAEKQGVKLEIVPFKSDQVGLRAMIAGEIDSYEGGLTGTVVAASKGIDIKLLGCHWQGLPHGIFVRNSIKSPQDLRGKIIAISTPFSHPDYLARALLAKNNIPVSDVKLANMGGDADRFKALIAGVVDATVVSNEYVPIADKNGVHLMVSAREILPEYIRLCIFATDRSLAKRETAVDFLAAEMKALRYALSHRDEAMKLTRQITGAKADDQRPEFIFDDAVKTSAVDPDLGLPMDKITWMRDRLVADGQLAAAFDINKMIEPSIRAKALELARSGH